MAVSGISTIAAMDAFLQLQTLTTGTTSVNATLREIANTLRLCAREAGVSLSFGNVGRVIQSPSARD
jgi:hypothetical protein